MLSYRKCNIMITVLTLIVLFTWGIACAEEGNDPDAARNAGMKHFLNGNYNEAIQEFEKVTGKRDYRRLLLSVI